MRSNHTRSNMSRVHTCTWVRAQLAKLCRSPGVATRLTVHGKRDQVSYAPPILEENGSGSGYFFINVTVSGIKYEGAEFKNLSQVSHFLAVPPKAFVGEEQVATRSSSARVLYAWIVHLLSSTDA